MKPQIRKRPSLKIVKNGKYIGVNYNFNEDFSYCFRKGKILITYKKWVDTNYYYTPHQYVYTLGCTKKKFIHLINEVIHLGWSQSSSIEWNYRNKKELGFSHKSLISDLYKALEEASTENLGLFMNNQWFEPKKYKPERELLSIT